MLENSLEQRQAKSCDEEMTFTTAKEILLNYICEDINSNLSAFACNEISKSHLKKCIAVETIIRNCRDILVDTKYVSYHSTKLVKAAKVFLKNIER